MGLKTRVSFVHNRVRRGVGLLLIWRHNLLCLHVYKELMHWKSVCDVKSGIDPLPFWLGIEQKLLGFLQVLKPIKWQDLLEGGKNAWNAFRTGAKIHFSEKNLGVRGTLILVVKISEKHRSIFQSWNLWMVSLFNLITNKKPKVSTYYI